MIFPSVVVNVITSKVILSLRTWAVWQQDRKVGLALVVLLVAAIVVECISVDRFLHTLECKALFPGPIAFRRSNLWGCSCRSSILWIQGLQCCQRKQHIIYCIYYSWVGRDWWVVLLVPMSISDLTLI